MWPNVVLSTVDRVRGLNPAAIYCCDPVMGDVGRGMFVLPGLPQLIRDRVVPVADVVTPNAFELAYLAFGGDPAKVSAESVSTVDGLLRRGADRPGGWSVDGAGDVGAR